MQCGRRFLVICRQLLRYDCQGDKMLATMSEDEVKTAVVLQLGQKEAYFCFDGVMKLTAFW
jgi:hypothetical protein